MSAWRRSHDRGPRAFRAPISRSLDRSTISLDNTSFIRQVVRGLNFLRLWKQDLLPLILERWITHKFTQGLHLHAALGITLRGQLKLVKLHVKRERAFTCSFPRRGRAVFRVLNLPPLLPLPPVSPALPWTAVRGCRSVTVARVHPSQP